MADLGPYVVDYTLSGRYLALAGRKGHLAIMDWKQARLITELQVRECLIGGKSYYVGSLGVQILEFRIDGLDFF